MIVPRRASRCHPQLRWYPFPQIASPWGRAAATWLLTAALLRLFGCDVSAVGPAAPVGALDAGAEATGSAMDAGVCTTEALDPGPPECRHRDAIMTASCANATFVLPEDPRVESFQRAYMATRGYPASRNILLPHVDLGFFID